MSTRRSSSLTRLSNLTIQAMRIRRTSTILPRTISILSLNILRLRTRFLNIFRNHFSIQNIRDPIISNANNRQYQLTLPNLSNRITMARRNTTILTITRSTDSLGTRLLNMRNSNLIRVLNSRTKVLRVDNRYNRKLTRSILLRYKLYTNGSA